jgi:hypothetical protein
LNDQVVHIVLAQRDDNIEIARHARFGVVRHRKRPCEHERQLRGFEALAHDLQHFQLFEHAADLRGT